MLKAGFLNLWATEEFLTGHSFVLLKLSTFCKVNFENRALVAMKTKSRSRLKCGRCFDMCISCIAPRTVFFKENVRYLGWTCRDPKSLILGTR